MGAWFVAVTNVGATPDLRFDVTTFCCGCSNTTFCTAQFNDLNFPSLNGHYLAMGSDAHRLDLATNGNVLAIYYNDLDDNYPTLSGADQAAAINGYAISNFTSTGPRPDWVVLNEISGGTWPTNATYRSWVEAVVHTLATTYGYNVMVYAPFANPANNSSDWQAVSADAYIAVENYLSGQEIQAEGYSVSWCQGQYQSSINSYASVGVPAGRLLLGEHYGQTLSGTGYGRSGVSSNSWDEAIAARSQAAANCSFAGDIGYDWGNDDMDVSTNEMIHFEDTYASYPLLETNGLTAPYLALPPQSQTAPAGSAVTFVAFQAGDAPTTYQWRFRGTNMPGETGETLVLTNIQVTDAGNYSVVLSNAVGTTASDDAYLTVGVLAPAAFDPFAYTAGANLIGQSNSTGTWTQAGPSGPQAMVQAGNLAVGGLAGPSGNSVVFGGNGISARFNPTPAISATTGTWYYSLAVRLTDISTLNSSGVFWAGFNNSSGTQSSTPTSVGTRLVTRSAAGGYNIGLDKTSGTTADLVFAPDVFTTNDTVFVVGSYTFMTGTSNDVSQLWIDPAATTFGLGTPPTPTLTNMAGNDLGEIASFVLFNRNANEPAGIIADELRLGNSWSSVTPPAELQAPPVLNISWAGNASALTWTTNATGFLPQSAPSLSPPVIWTDVDSLIYILAGQYVVTNAAGSAEGYYRLEQP